MQTHLLPARKSFPKFPIVFICFFVFGCNLLNAANPESHHRESMSQAWDRSDHHLSLRNNHASLQSWNPAQQQPSFLADVWDDFCYVVREPDFYLIVGGLAAAPNVFKSAFKNEDDEFASMWGSSKFADEFFESGSGAGNSVYHFSAAFISYFTGKLSHDNRLQSFGSDLLRAQLVNGMATLTLKGLVNRTRPNGQPYSFPSGHTSTAFTTATIVYHDFGPVWGSAAYLGATYVGFSRMESNKHYLSDVIGGAVLGTYLSFKLMHRKERESGLEITPLMGKDYRGLNLQMRF